MKGQKIGVLVIKQTYEGKKPECLTFQYGFKQVISDPTHILESGSSCIDLIFKT